MHGTEKKFDAKLKSDIKKQTKHKINSIKK
jgi:hypothetical protein